MRYLIMVRADTDTEAGGHGAARLAAGLAAYHDALQKAGVLLDANTLAPSAAGWRIRRDRDGACTVSDGPFADVRELIAGYALIEVRSRDEALEWTRRFPVPPGPAGLEIEVRPVSPPAAPGDTAGAAR